MSSAACSGLAQRWGMPRELAYDLAALALYDIVIYCDDSGSMTFEENGGSVPNVAGAMLS